MAQTLLLSPSMNTPTASNPEPSTPPNYTLRGLMVAGLVLLLLIPSAFIAELVSERQGRHEQAIQEVAASWGQLQSIAGPLLVVPYTAYVTTESVKNGYPVSEKRAHQRHMVFLPETLDVSGNISTKVLHRSIYEVPVYEGEFQLRGRFRAIQAQEFPVPLDQVDLASASLLLEIRDLRGMQSSPRATWNQRSMEFRSGILPVNIRGIQAPVSVHLGKSGDYLVELDIRGSRGFRIKPLGRNVDVKIDGNWPHPSFVGGFLPTSRNITDEDFAATWQVSHINQEIPEKWTSTLVASREQQNDLAQPLNAAEDLGADLVTPVDNYDVTERSVKYAILVLGLTFFALFFVEVLKKLRVHPIQYILIGLALCVFYTLLLSISEHLGFNMAYGLAAGATTLLVGMYVRSVLGTWGMAGLFFSVLGALYTCLFVLLQLESHALLMGSVGLFVVLALVMYLTRRMDWAQS